MSSVSAERDSIGYNPGRDLQDIDEVIASCRCLEAARSKTSK